MKQEIKHLINDLWTYYEGLVDAEFKWITKLPPSLQPMGRKFGIQLYKNLLYANHLITKPYSHQRYQQ